MGKRKTLTLRDYVNAFGRDVRLYKIAADLGLHQSRLSLLLRGAKPSKPEADKLRAHGIEVTS